MDGKIPSENRSTQRRNSFMIIVSLLWPLLCVFQCEIFFLTKNIFATRKFNQSFCMHTWKAFFIGEKRSQQFYSILVLHPLVLKKEEHLVDLHCWGPWYKIFDFNSIEITVFQRFLNLTISFWNIEIEFLTVAVVKIEPAEALRVKFYLSSCRHFTFLINVTFSSWV